MRAERIAVGGKTFELRYHIRAMLGQVLSAIEGSGLGQAARS